MRTLFLVVVAALALAGGAAAASFPPAVIATGQDAGWPDARGWLASGNPAYHFNQWGSWQLAFSPYSTYKSGVRVAVGDVDGDGRAELVTAPGGSGFTELRVFDGTSYRQLGSLLPYRDASWWNGVFLATGDTNADGRAEIVDGLDAGCCTSLHVLDGVSGSELSGWMPYGDRSETGARVAAGDVNRDGKAEILALPVGGTRVSVFGATGGPAVRSFQVLGSSATGRAAIAAGDVAGDGAAELVAASSTYGGVQVNVIDAGSASTIASYFPWGSATASAVDVAVADVDGNGRADVIVLAQFADGTQIKVLDRSGSDLASFYVLEPGIVPGASLAAGDLDGDGRAEIVLGGGPTQEPWPPVANGPDQRVAIYRGDGSRVGSFAAYPGLFQGGVRVALADLDRDRRPELVTAPGPGMPTEIGVFTQEWVNGRDRGTRLAHFTAFEDSFQGGATVAAGDVQGDGKPEIVVGAGPGRAPEVRVFDAAGRRLSSFLAFEPGYTGGISVAAGDLNADGVAEIVAGTLAAPARIQAFARGVPTGPLIVPFGADGPGVYVGLADVAGSGRSLIVAAAGGAEPLLRVLESSGSVVRDVRPQMRVTTGLRAAGGDLDLDGRDEVVVTTGWGGDGTVRVLGGNFRQKGSFTPYPWEGWGMNVAVRARVGLPIVASGRPIRLTAHVRSRVTVARFRDAAGARPPGRRSARIGWGDGTGSWAGTVVSRGGGVYDVQGVRRYRRAGHYTVTVTFTAPDGRISIAHSKAVVRRHQG